VDLEGILEELRGLRFQITGIEAASGDQLPERNEAS
jgi:hypothetical protein